MDPDGDPNETNGGSGQAPSAKKAKATKGKGKGQGKGQAGEKTVDHEVKLAKEAKARVRVLAKRADNVADVLEKNPKGVLLVDRGIDKNGPGYLNLQTTTVLRDYVATSGTSPTVGILNSQ